MSSDTGWPAGWASDEPSTSKFGLPEDFNSHSFMSSSLCDTGAIQPLSASKDTFSPDDAEEIREYQELRPCTSFAAPDGSDDSCFEDDDDDYEDRVLSPVDSGFVGSNEDAESHSAWNMDYDPDEDEDLEDGEELPPNPRREKRAYALYQHLKQLNARGSARTLGLTKADLKPPEVAAPEKPAKRFECKDCDFSTSRRHALLSHRDQVHRDVRAHKCKECGEAFKRSEHLNRHVKAKHSEDIETSHPFKCDECATSRRFSSQQLLDRHMSSVHSKEATFKCPECSYSAKLKRVLEMHLRKRHYRQHYAKSCRYCDFTGIGTWLRLHEDRCSFRPKADLSPQKVHRK